MNAACLKLRIPTLWWMGILLACGQTWGGPFTESYSVETLAPGRWEYVQWVTANEDKDLGTYTNLAFRNEIKYGVASNWETGLSVVSQYVDAFHDLRNQTTGGMGVPANADPTRPYTSYNFYYVAPEVHYRLLDPKVAPVGIGFYFEPSMGPDHYRLQPRLLLQKDLLQGRLICTSNIDWNWDWSNNGYEWNKTMTFTVSGGISYHLFPHWWTGIEGRQQSDFSSFSPSSIQDFIFSLGPSIGYEDKGWWIKGVVLPQLPAGEALTSAAQSEVINGEIYTSSHAAIEIQIKVGFKF